MTAPFSLVVAGPDLVFASARADLLSDQIHRVPLVSLNSTGFVIHTDEDRGRIRNVVVDGGSVFAFVNRTIMNTSTDVVLQVGVSAPIESRSITGSFVAPMIAARDGTIAWSRRNNPKNIGLQGVMGDGIVADDGPTCLVLTDDRLLWAGRDLQSFTIRAVNRNALDASSVGLNALDGLCVGVESADTAAVFASAGKIVVENGANGFVVADLHPTAAGGAVVDVAIDATFIWWVVDHAPLTQHVLVRAPREAPHTAQVVTSIGKPCGLAVDDDHVYWSECGLASDVIRRIRKPAP